MNHQLPIQDSSLAWDAAEVSICRGGQMVTLHGLNYFGFEVRCAETLPFATCDA